ncbi:hypothetical protein [Risungbinella massiliensis]|uniref:hypothetical protein n=1 Tax=Risungbinella massiliensis TaxID=1329796 RepID=UPI0011CB4932|nr:hypothetical protein [Risungbinella massiliensis]
MLEFILNVSTDVEDKINELNPNLSKNRVYNEIVALKFFIADFMTWAKYKDYPDTKDQILNSVHYKLNEYLKKIQADKLYLLFTVRLKEYEEAVKTEENFLLATILQFCINLEFDFKNGDPSKFKTCSDIIQNDFEEVIKIIALTSIS